MLFKLYEITGESSEEITGELAAKKIADKKMVPKFLYVHP